MARKINKKKINKVEVIEKDIKTPKFIKFDTAINFHPRNERQKELVEAIETNNIVFALGAAGTGKTLCAVAQGLNLMQQNKVDRMILTRPAVEAGEKLGTLPGEVEDKLLIYLMPLVDSLDRLIGVKARKFYMEKEIIKILPLGLARGLTFENSYVILDEAQNCTPVQLKMFLTRLGKRSHICVNGDPSQIDLPYWQLSGLQMTVDKLQGIEGISTVEFSEADIVRHRLVKEIVKRLVDDPPKEE